MQSPQYQIAQSLLARDTNSQVPDADFTIFNNFGDVGTYSLCVNKKFILGRNQRIYRRGRLSRKKNGKVKKAEEAAIKTLQEYVSKRI